MQIFIIKFPHIARIAIRILKTAHSFNLIFTPFSTISIVLYTSYIIPIKFSARD